MSFLKRQNKTIQFEFVIEADNNVLYKNKKNMAPRPSPQIGNERIRLVLDNGIKKARITKHSKPKDEMSLKMIHLQKLQESLNLEMVAQTKAAQNANLKVSQIFMNTLMDKKSLQLHLCQNNLSNQICESMS